MTMLKLFTAGAVSVALLTGCGTTEPDPEPTVSFAADVQPILTLNCANIGCHLGPDPQQEQDLSEGNAYANIVNVASMELPSMNRITPSDPEQSYLVHKIQGTHLDVGGVGERMPLNRTPLPDENIETIRLWVAQGARNN